MDDDARKHLRRAGQVRQASERYDIADAVSKAEGRRVAANSVYRILDLFVGANLARRVESSKRLYRQRASRLPARLHLPGLRQLRPDRAHRRRQDRQQMSAMPPRRRALSVRR